jgi:hypothetical protein
VAYIPRPRRSPDIEYIGCSSVSAWDNLPETGRSLSVIGLFDVEILTNIVNDMYVSNLGSLFQNRTVNPLEPTP